MDVRQPALIAQPDLPR